MKLNATTILSDDVDPAAAGDDGCFLAVDSVDL